MKREFHRIEHTDAACTGYFLHVYLVNVVRIINLHASASAASRYELIITPACMDNQLRFRFAACGASGARQSGPSPFRNSICSVCRGAEVMLDHPDARAGSTRVSDPCLVFDVALLDKWGSCAGSQSGSTHYQASTTANFSDWYSPLPANLRRTQEWRFSSVRSG